MGSIYLQPNEYAAFGVPKATAQQIGEACNYIDSWLRRPEGLIWMPDAAGNPAYMLGLTPNLTLTLAGAIAPGKNVVVNVTGPLMALNVGDSLVADRADNTKVESVIVVAKNGNALTLGNVGYAHAQGSLLEAGLAIIERKSPPKNRPIINLKRTPVQRVVSGRGRYAYSRRGDSRSGNTDDFNLLAVYNTFGGPPVWELFDPTVTEFSPGTGELWIPAGIMLAYYTEVEVGYVAGFSQATLPSEIKTACSKLVRALANDPDLGSAKSYRAGGSAVEKFADTFISGDVANLLQPYRAKLMA